MAFRLLSGATAPYTRSAGACVEIVFVGIGLFDRLNYAGRNALYSAMSASSNWHYRSVVADA